MTSDLQALATLLLRKEPYWVGGWIGLRPSLDMVTKRKTHTSARNQLWFFSCPTCKLVIILTELTHVGNELTTICPILSGNVLFFEPDFFSVRVLDTFAKLRIVSISFVISVCLSFVSLHGTIHSHWTDLHEIYIWVFFQN